VRQNLIRGGGAAGIACALLLIVRAIADLTLDADIYADEAVDFLPAIEFNRSGVLIAVLMVFLAPLALLPFLVGLYLGADDEHRPLALLSAVFSAFGLVILVVAFVVYATELQVASEFLTAQDTLRAAIAQDGEMLILAFIILEQLAYAAFGIGTALAAVLFLRTALVPKWLGYFSFAVAALQFGYFIVPWLVVWLHPLWLAGVGWYLYEHGSRPSAAPGQVAQQRRTSMFEPER
jgi:Domain of unknown function (DUF4386)